jgi:hypothetical protein
MDVSESMISRSTTHEQETHLWAQFIALAADAAAPRGLSFCLSYGSGAAEQSLSAELLCRGWSRSVEASSAALLWLPYSRVPWASVTSSEQPPLCAAYPVRTALVRKDALARTLARATGVLAPLSFSLQAGSGEAAEEELLEQLAAAAEPCLGPAWIVKQPAVNNSLGLELVGSSREQQRAAVRRALSSPGAAAVLVQQYVQRPLLLQGCKFHCRVNVLCVGACAVYVHRQVVCHVACEPLLAALPAAGFQRSAHITNHVVQRAHPAYDRQLHTLLLPELLARLQLCSSASQLALQEPAVFGSLCSSVRRVLQAALAGKRCSWEPLPDAAAGAAAGAASSEGPAAGTRPLPFLVLPNCFELFGFDFLLQEEERQGAAAAAAAAGRGVQPVLLEVNGGPALEGLARPELCAAIAKDTVELLLAPGPSGQPGAWALPGALPPEPEPGSSWKRVL